MHDNESAVELSVDRVRSGVNASAYLYAHVCRCTGVKELAWDSWHIRPTHEPYELARYTHRINGAYFYNDLHLYTCCICVYILTIDAEFEGVIGCN